MNNSLNNLSEQLVVGITMGDPLGIGAEIIVKALDDPLLRRQAKFIIFGMAEQLGYAVLIAEGSPVVMSLIETGQVEAVIGVSCMSVLEQVFPYTEAAAIPGAAIPLLQDGCCDTTVDVDWVWDAIYRTADEDTGWLNLEQLKEQVQAWFTEDSLRIALQWRGGDTENLALAWLAKAGKRWRPFLAACAHQAVAPSTSESPGEDLRKAAVAVECFHKASLVHDDIEDGDNTRYGQKTLHAEHGIPIALNVGDFLLGEGYRLLTELNVSGDRIKKLVQAAVKGHRDLCIGQGDELAWLKKPKQLTVDQVINIFQKKTSAAFEVALSLGVTLAGGSDELGVPLEQYSRSLGIAYQIRDDIDDFGSCENLAAEIGSRPSLLLALACEMAEDKDKKLLESVWSGRGLREDEEQDIRDIFEKLQVEQAALNLMQFHKSQAIGSLAPLKSTALKALLRRVIAKIFNDLDVMRCCNDHPARHEKGSSEGEASAG